MKRTFLFLSACAALFGQEKEEQNFSYWDVHPLHAGGNAIFLGKASVTDTPYGGDLTFAKYNAFVSLLVPLSRESYFFPRIEWNTFHLDWNKNPKFHKTDYSYIQFALTFYTIAIEKWRWILRGNYNIGVDNFNEPHEYGLFEGLIWGAYQIHRKWHYHLGIFGYTGFEGAQMYPVLGADYSPNKKWTFLLVFPITYEIQYHVDKNWRLSLKGRPLKERFRTSSHQPQPRSVFSYSTMGAEFNVHYERFLRLEVEAFVGCNFGGSFYIKDAHNHNPLYSDVGMSPYAGANLDFGF